jgi:ligand-binding SRPBCC domain-containing protein
MRLYKLERKQIIPAKIDDVWNFFSNPIKLNMITPPDLALNITSELPHEVFAGLLIIYTVRPFTGMKVKWVTEITHVERPYMFVDEQRFGPYRFWHHRHIFREVSEGTEAEDYVVYALRFDPFSRPINAIFVKRQLEYIFDYRREAIRKIFGVE